MPVDHLSGPWLAAADAELAAHDRLRSAAAHCALGLTQVVAGAPADVVYHFTSHGGEARIGWGPADPEDVRIRSDATVVRDIARGRRNAKEAFITGQLTITGDVERLLAARALLEGLDAAMAAVAEHTRFDDA